MHFKGGYAFFCTCGYFQFVANNNGNWLACHSTQLSHFPFSFEREPFCSSRVSNNLPSAWFGYDSQSTRTKTNLLCSHFVLTVNEPRLSSLFDFPVLLIMTSLVSQVDYLKRKWQNDILALSFSLSFAHIQSVVIREMCPQKTFYSQWKRKSGREWHYDLVDARQCVTCSMRWICSRLISTSSPAIVNTIRRYNR